MDLVKPRWQWPAALVIVASVAHAEPSECSIDRWAPYIAEASVRFDVSPEWLRAVMRAESAGCQFMNGAPTTSSAGAMGLMQLMPGTWNELRNRLSLGPDPYDPHDNILASAAYLRELLDRFGASGFLAAYHAGPARYQQHLKDGQSLPVATQNYLQRIERDLVSSRNAFVTRNERQIASHQHGKQAPNRSLFVALRHDESDAETQIEEPHDVQRGEIP